MVEAVTNGKVKPKRTKAIPLVKGHRMPKAVQNLLETREVKLRRFLDQTSSNKTSSTYEKEINHTTNSA